MEWDNIAKMEKSTIQPTDGDVHVKRPLTNVAIQFWQKDERFIANRVFPMVEVMHKADQYYTFDRGDWNRDEQTSRRPATESAGVAWNLGTETYNCDLKAVHNDIPDEVRANQDSVINVEQTTTKQVTQMAMIRKDRDWVANFFTSGKWTFNTQGGSAKSASFDPSGTTANTIVQWTNSASDPIDQVKELKLYIEESTGYEPNIFVCGPHVWRVLSEHPDIIGRINQGQTSGPAMASKQAVAALFEIEEILVIRSIYNKAKKGADNDHEFIGGNHGLLLYRTDAPSLMEPSAGYSFSWSGYMGMQKMGIRIKRYRIEHRSCTRVEAETAYDQKLTAKDMGCFMENLIA